MVKKFRTIKTGIIFGLLLFSLFAVFTPNASAIKINSALKVEFDEEDIKQKVMPAAGYITIGLDVFYQYYGVGASWIAETSLLKDIPAQVDLKVVYAPEWCTATVTPPLLTLSAGTSFSDPARAAIIISVNENAPAFVQEKVIIAAHSTKVSGVLFSIEEKTIEVDIPFEVDYSPAISFTTSKGNFMEIGPLDTAEFEIEIENLANAPTEVTCEILNAPEGWSPNIVSTVLLSSRVLGEEGTAKTVHFKIKPPHGFGLHDESQYFQVKLTSYYYRDPSLVGKEYILTFNVQSRGFSPGIGFEIPLIAASLIVTGSVIYLYRKGRKKK